MILLSCQDEDQEFGDIIVPSNLSISFEIVGADGMNPNGDGSGFVNFSASADNAITFTYSFGDNSDNEVAPSGEITHRFVQQGTNTYTVTVIATGTGGVAATESISISVFSAFNDQEAKDLLTGGASSSKTWYLAASQTGHLGVGPSLDFDILINGGPAQYYFPAFFAAAPFQICGGDPDQCLCNDELTFSQDAGGQLTFELNNNGATFFNAGHQEIVGGSVGSDACFDFDTSGISTVTLGPSEEDWSLLPQAAIDAGFDPRGTVLNFSDDKFMGYYVSSSTYEILEISDNFLYVRTEDGLDSNLAWYHKFTTSPPFED